MYVMRGAFFILFYFKDPKIVEMFDFLIHFNAGNICREDGFVNEVLRFDYIYCCLFSCSITFLDLIPLLISVNHFIFDFIFYFCFVLFVYFKFVFTSYCFSIKASNCVLVVLFELISLPKISFSLFSTLSFSLHF